MAVFVNVGTRQYVQAIAPDVTCIAELLSSLSLSLQEPHLRENDLKQGLHQLSFYVICNGHKLEGNSILENGKSYHIIPRLLGGKGGFGSMLRAIGAQIEKTTSREACRDLSGRRMRDINNEKKLKEWLAKEADRERERHERRQERLERRLRPPQHKFDDAQYHEQRSKVQEDLEDALQKGLKRTKKNDKSEDFGAGPSKKSKVVLSKDMFGIDIDSDDLQSDSDNEADPGFSDEHRNSNLSSSSADSPKACSLTAVSDHNADHMKEEPNGHLSESCNTQHQDILLDSNGVKTEEPVVKEEVIDPNEPVDLEDYGSYLELAVLGMERLKNALMERGLKCGGTLEERAVRLFSVKDLTQDQIDPCLFARSKGKGKKSK